MNKKRVIWSDEVNLKDWEDMFVEYGMEDADEYDKFDMVMDELARYRDDEYVNLDIALPNDIVCFAELGLWNGISLGVRTLSNNVNEIFRMNCNEFYCDRYNVKGIEHHHDGTNYYTFRVWNDISEEEKEDCIQQYIDGVLSAEELRKYTSSIKSYVDNVYGW